jgi:hypothetical protein
MWAFTPFREHTLMIEPRPRARMWGKAAVIVQKAA